MIWMVAENKKNTKKQEEKINEPNQKEKQ